MERPGAVALGHIALVGAERIHAYLGGFRVSDYSLHLQSHYLHLLQFLL